MAVKQSRSQEIANQGITIAVHGNPGHVGEYASHLVEKVSSQLSGVKVVNSEMVKSKENCRESFRLNENRIEELKRKVSERNLAGHEVVICVLNIDDPNGSKIAKAFMTEEALQSVREKEVPRFASGLILDRPWFVGLLDTFDVDAAVKLRELSGLATVIVDHGVAEAFEN